MTQQEVIVQLEQRRQFFKQYSLAPSQTSFRKDKEIQLDSTCPACGYPTLYERSSWEICSICRWEDDGQDDLEADEVWGGPNGDYSLTEWRWEAATMLAALQADAVHLRPEQKEIGLTLRTIKAFIENNRTTNTVLLQQQIEVLMSLFDKFYSDQTGG